MAGRFCVRRVVMLFFMVGKGGPFPLDAHRWLKTKSPSGVAPEGRKSVDVQNPCGAPLTADTTTDERLEEPIEELEAARLKFMKLLERKPISGACLPADACPA